MHQDNQEAFARALARGLRARPDRLRVDLRAVDLFTSAGLNALLRAGLAARVLGVALALDSPSRCVRRVLESTRSAPYLPVENSDPLRERRADRGRPPGRPRAGRDPAGPR
nr:STAS domain-containing protein [Kitasatospora sp. SID7827]